MLLVSLLLPCFMADVPQKNQIIQESALPSQRPSSNEKMQQQQHPPNQRTDDGDQSTSVKGSEVTESPQPSSSLSQDHDDDDDDDEIDSDDERFVCSPLIWSPDLAVDDAMMSASANSENEGNVVIIPFRPQSRQCPASNGTKSSRMRKTTSSSEKAKEAELSEDSSLNHQEAESSTQDDATPPQLDQQAETIQSANETTTKESAIDEQADTATMSMAVDYASKSAGALVIEKSSGWKGTSSLLMSDNDRYALVPTNENPKYVIIALSEEINVKQVVLSNYERYSANVKQFQIWGSQTMAEWAIFGEFTAKVGSGKQTFELTQSNNNWARYLKFKFLDHYFEDEHYLTITQISVHGTTMQQGFQEHWDQQDEVNEFGDIENVENVESTKVIASDSIENPISEETRGNVEASVSSAGQSASNRESVSTDATAGEQLAHAKVAGKDPITTEGSQSTSQTENVVKKQVEPESLNANEISTTGSGSTNTTKTDSNHSTSPETTSSTTISDLNQSAVEMKPTESSSGGEGPAETHSEIDSADAASTVKRTNDDRHGLQSIFKVSDDPNCHCLNENGYLDGRLSDCLHSFCPKDATVEGRTLAVLASASLTKHYESHIRSLNRWSIQAKELDRRRAAQSNQALGIFTEQMESQSSRVNHIGLNLSTCQVPKVAELALDLDQRVQKRHEMAKKIVKTAPSDTAEAPPSPIPGSVSQMEGETMDKKDGSGVGQPTSTKMESEMANAAMIETLQTLSQHFPSAICLADLSKSLQQLQQNHKHKATQARQQAGGNANMGPSGPSGGMEPIFKKLTDEIKALQSTVHGHEKLSKDLITCFQRLLVDALAEQERSRLSQEARIQRLEEMVIAHQRSATDWAVERLHAVLDYVLSIDWDNAMRQLIQESLHTTDDVKELAHGASSVLGPMGNALGGILLLGLSTGLLLFRYRVKPTFIRKASC